MNLIGGGRKRNALLSDRNREVYDRQFMQALKERKY
jgi:hypothetical protein